MKDTKIIRVPVHDATSNKTFEERLTSLCNVQLAAGYEVRSMMAMGLDIVVIFQSAK